MNLGSQPAAFNHHLVARVEAHITGAEAHDIHALLGNYYELCLIAEHDHSVIGRVLAIEVRLRAFCQGKELMKANCDRPRLPFRAALATIR